MKQQAKRLAVIGGGWAGMAAAVTAAQSGFAVSVLEASRSWGGRARRVDREDGNLDNGQHILIGAYRECLQLMRSIGLDAARLLKRQPLELAYADGVHLRAGPLPAPLHLVQGIAFTSGLSLAERKAWLELSLKWKLRGWSCEPQKSVADISRGLPRIVMERFIEPLCVSALNTPAREASGQVFLNVLKASLGSSRADSDFLLPRTDLSALFPEPAAAWLTERGHRAELGARVSRLSRSGAHWLVNDESFDAVVLATPPWVSAQLLGDTAIAKRTEVATMVCQLQALSYAPITTVYAHADRSLGIQGRVQRRSQPMMALSSDEAQPFQFVFDRSQLGFTRETGSIQWAFVVSDARATLGYSDDQWTAAIAEAAQQLRIGFWPRLDQSITEKRATFVCSPGLVRPGSQACSNLYLAGDYVDGPFPATLEGAVSSGISAARALATEKARGRPQPQD